MSSAVRAVAADSPTLSLRVPPAPAASGGRAAILRTSAYLLAFIAGGAAMFAWQEWRQGRSSTVSQTAPSAAMTAAPELPSPSTLPQPLAPRVRPTLFAAQAWPPAEASEGSIEESTVEPRIAAAPLEVTTASLLRIAGITEPAPGRFAALPLATSQAVAFVDVRPGDRVKKGWQVFAHWESPDRLEAEQTEIHKAKKLLEIARERADAAERISARQSKLAGNTSAQELESARSAAAIRREEVRAAELAVAQAESQFKAMQFEFNQAFVTSPIDGLVASVDVVLGERRQIGGPFRGVTVVDPRVLHCRCMLSPRQLAALPEGAAQAASATGGAPLAVTVESANRRWPAKITFIGSVADRATGLVPVLLDVDNADESLRAGIAVDVCFSHTTQLR